METVKSPAEQKVILHNASWGTYERLMDERGESRVPRFAFDRGELEIMSPQAEHESISYAAALLIEVLAEEIDITSPSLNKLPIYARLGVREVWRYDGERMHILVLGADGYVERTASLALPPLTDDVLTRLATEGTTLGRRAWMREVRDRARSNAGTSG